MNLERVSAALGPADGRARRQRRFGRDSRPRLRHARGHAGPLFFCVPRFARRRPRPRPAGGRRGRRGAGRRAAADVPVPQLVVPSVRHAMPVAANLFFGNPSAELDRRGGHRHERQDHLGVPAPLDPRCRRPAARRADEHRAAGRRLGPPDRAEHARGDRPAEALPRDARGRRPELRDGGDVDRRRPGTPRRHALRGAPVHEPDPGPPRLPRDDGGLLRGEARALRPGRAGGRERRGRMGETARAGAARRA